jgi:hypothetical protein
LCMVIIIVCSNTHTKCISELNKHA